jgi:hypothetical protein
MRDLDIALSSENIAAGEAYLADTPVLHSHTGTQPDLLLRWNGIPLRVAAVDVIVFLHGFSRQGRAMPLAEKVPSSGLDLSRRKRPTLALLPRGNWLRYTWYDFPALIEGGMDRLVEYGLQRCAEAAGRGPLALDRLVLAAHSGGGMPAVDVIAGGWRPDELYVFDGLYGRDPSRGDPMRGLETIDEWLAERLAQEPERAGALRVIYIEQQTGRFSRAVGELISRRLTDVEPALAETLRRRYRAEVSLVQHSEIARRCMSDLLAAPDAEFDWSQGPEIHRRVS